MIKLTKKVDKAIRHLRADGYGNFSIIGMLFDSDNFIDIEEINTILSFLDENKINREEFAEALIKGYEVVRDRTKREEISYLIREFYGWYPSKDLINEIEKIVKDENIEWGD